MEKWKYMHGICFKLTIWWHKWEKADHFYHQKQLNSCSNWKYVAIFPLAHHLAHNALLYRLTCFLKCGEAAPLVWILEEWFLIKNKHVIEKQTLCIWLTLLPIFSLTDTTPGYLWSFLRLSALKRPTMFPLWNAVQALTRLGVFLYFTL